MEVAVLASLLGLGFAVSKLGGGDNSKKNTNGSKINIKPKKINQTLKNIEGFAPAARGSDKDPLTNTPKGASVVGRPSELDQMYSYPNGKLYPSEPNPGPYGNAFGYASQNSAVLPDSAKLGKSLENFGNYSDMSGRNNQGSLISSKFPEPVSIDSNVPMVEFRSDNIESSPNYVKGDYVISPLSGQKIPSKDYRHNNMQPFFGGSVKQNISSQANQSRLDAYTGSGSTQIAKREVENMFQNAQAPYGNPFGMENQTEFFQSRIVDPNQRNGERPFEQVKVGSGIGEDYGFLGKGGFQQLEVNDVMRGAMKTDVTRTVDNPKLTYKGVLVPGKHFIGASPDSNTYGEVRKYKPDTFYIDHEGERLFTTNGEYIAETVRPVQVMPFTSRSETTSELVGTPVSTDYEANYVAGSYRNPMTQQYGGAGYRNANLETYYTKDVGSSQADYGRSSYENKPNEREFTSERVMGLNVVPAETGLVQTHPADDARPTRRSETVGNPRLTGNGNLYDDKAPAITVWDPQDIARTTVKETTIYLDRPGIASSGAAPNRLKVYDPDDIARPTQKAQLSNHNWTGPGISASKDGMDTQFAYNMRTNPNKEVIARGRKPIAGSGGLAIFTGEIHQTTKKLDTDSINDRPNAVNRAAIQITPGVGDIGRLEYRVPLKLDVSRERNTQDIVQAVDNNPLQQSLHKNAAHDSELLKELGF